MAKLDIAKLNLNKGQLDVSAWMFHLRQEYPEIDFGLLEQAVSVADRKGLSVETPMGQSCLHQGLGMVEILLDLNIDVETLSAAMLYGTAQYAKLSLSEVENFLGQDVAAIIRGANRMNALHSLQKGMSEKTQFANTIDNFRKMLLAMVDDMRVVLLKLAEQLYILHHLDGFSKEEQKRIARESMDIYASLANRLGVGHLKWQIEDMAFRYLDPDTYKSISKSLNVRRAEREIYVKKVIKQLKKVIEKDGVYDAKIMGRAKHIYSIYRKMQRKKVDIEEIYDATALRILVTSIEDCYAALGCVHSVWSPIQKEFDDYIANPKPNGYRSVHTAIIGPDDQYVEIQIRTYEMHDESELGVAAHWAYKESPQKRDDFEDKILWLRQVMDWQKEVAEQEDEGDAIEAGVFDARVYVFTPDGDVIDLPNGSTPLDFAYHIHTEIGHRCRGAKIGGLLVPLTYQLKTGDRVEILTAKNGKPSRDWLNPHLGYVKTARAKAKVQNWFRKQDYGANLVRGREMLDKELKRMRIREVDLTAVAEKMNYLNLDDLSAALGGGDVRISAIIGAIQSLQASDSLKEQKQDKPLFQKAHQETKKTGGDFDIVIEGVGGLLTSIAKCCKPVPGDAIVGYVTVGRGVSIHRQDCLNLIQEDDARQDRLISVKWGGKTQEKYSVDLIIQAYDRQDLLRDIAQLFANEKINMSDLRCKTDKSTQIVYIFITGDIENVSALERLVANLNKLSGVFEVRRSN